MAQSLHGNAESLNGLAAGPCETLMPQVIADIIFLHDRGKYQTLYFSMYFISLMVRALPAPGSPSPISALSI